MATRGVDYPRQARDYYPTPAQPIAALFKTIPFAHKLCDPCCGNGCMLTEFAWHGYEPFGFDIDPWGSYAKFDFLRTDLAANLWLSANAPFDIVTNPPFGVQGRMAYEFIRRALEVTEPWHGRVAMLLNVDYDSGKTRAPVFRDHPAFAARIALLDRIPWFNGQTGSTNHAWYYWEWDRDPAFKPMQLYA